MPLTEFLHCKIIKRLPDWNMYQSDSHQFTRKTQEKHIEMK